jgi:3-hydroxyanthranilate 3,4-dioxygenase
MSSPFQAISISDYVTELAPTLKPPVANRVWFLGTKFFVMIVAGPNKRDDFHYQPGQELFFQLMGPMNVNIMEDGVRKGVPIQEGEMLLLPEYVHHSPQRFPDTIGTILLD